MKPLLSNAFYLFITIFMVSCRLGTPVFEQAMIQPNFFKEEDGEISEFLSLKFSASSSNDAGRVATASIRHNDSGLFWPLDPDKKDGSIYTASFLQGSNATLPRGQYTVEMSNAFGDTATRTWTFPIVTFNKNELVFPSQETLPIIPFDVYFFIYYKDMFIAEHLLRPNEKLPLLLQNENAYLYYFHEGIGYGLMQKVGSG